jgi:DNA-binding response OmpR family regulator
MDQTSSNDRLPRVLIAEDDDELRLLIASSVREDGYEVLEARDGSELLDVVAESLAGNQSQTLDLIVSDAWMPGFTALDVLLGLDCVSCRIPVILITAFGDDATHALARALGALTVFDKPFDLDDLRSAIGHTLACSGKE